MLYGVHLMHHSQSSSLDERTKFKWAEVAQRPKTNSQWLYYLAST